MTEHPTAVGSVLSSRWDAAADPLLALALQGRLGLAMAQKVFADHRSLLEEERWQSTDTKTPKEA